MKRVAAVAIPIVIATVFVVAVVTIRRNAMAVSWEGSATTVSEEAYAADKVADLIRAWQESKRELLQKERAGRADEYEVYLVIDLEGLAMWLERSGKVDPTEHFELPSKLEWGLYLVTPEGHRELTSPARFKIRGRGTYRPELVVLAGTKGSRGHVEASFNRHTRGAGRSSGAFGIPTIRAPAKKTDDHYPSIVVGEEEYQAYRAKLDTGGAGAAAAEVDGLSEELIRNREDWLKVEAELYREIERQVKREGLDLERLSINVGPSYHGAHAEVRARRPKSFLPWFGRPMKEWLLLIEYLSDGVWYARNVPNRRMRPRYTGPMEFVLSASGGIPAQEGRWVEEGRARAAAEVAPASQWIARLPNGATVEFLGVCRSPSRGKHWWGPDGQPLDYVPYYTPREILLPHDRNTFDFAYRIATPRSGGRRMGLRAEGNLGGGSGTRVDKYGQRVDAISNETCIFAKSRATTTIRVGVTLADGPRQWVEFRNISLVPGKSAGPQLVLSGPEADGR